MIFQISYYFREKIVFSALCINIFITGNDPLCPAIWGFCVISAFHSRKVKAFGETFPWFKGVRKVRHNSPYANYVSIPVFLDQIANFFKMGICISP